MSGLLFFILSAAVAFGVWRLSRETRGGPDSRTPRGKSAKPELSAQDMAPCPVCAAYVVRGASHCGRGGCPYPPDGGKT